MVVIKFKQGVRSGRGEGDTVNVFFIIFKCVSIGILSTTAILVRRILGQWICGLVFYTYPSRILYTLQLLL